MSEPSSNEGAADVNGQVGEQQEQQNAAAPGDSAPDSAGNFAEQEAQVQYPSFNMDEPASATTGEHNEHEQQNLEAAALGVQVGEQEQQQQQQQQHEQVAAPTDSYGQQQAQEQEQPVELICRICGKGTADADDPTGRKRRLMVRFLPVAVPFSDSAVSTWDQDVQLHVFCGKTASILPTVNQPDLEILSKAGVKNKHGIGPEVNAALARTRCAILSGQEISASREKEFFLIKEFEAHLQAIRTAHGHAVALAAAASEEAQQAAAYHQQAAAQHHHHLPPAPPHYYHHQQHVQEKQVPHKAGQSYTKPTRGKTTTTAATPHEDHNVDWALHHAVAAATSDADLLGQQAQFPHEEQLEEPQAQEDDLSDGKIRCGCGGSHLPTGTPKGAASWRSHVMTKRHQQWMEENGMLGAV